MIANRSKTLITLLACTTICAAFSLSCNKDPVRVIPGTPRNNDPLSGTRKPPVANAGPDQTILILHQYVFAKLNAAGSSDSSIIPLKYNWRQLTGPISISIQTPDNVETWIGPVTSPGDFSFELKAFNANGSDVDTVKISFQSPGYCPANRPEIPASLTFKSNIPGLGSYTEMYVAGNKLIFPEWFDNQTGNTTNKIHIYDLISSTWNTINASLPRTSVSTIVAGGKIFFAGGLDSDLQATRVVDIYDIATNTWTTNQLSQARGGIAATQLGNKIYFAGGVGDYQMVFSRRIDIYDLQTKTWSTDDLPTVGRVNIKAVAVQDKVLFAGGYTRFDGYNFDTPSPIIEVFNTTGNYWSFDTLTVNKTEFAAIEVNNNVFFAGGVLNNNLTFHVETKNWTTLNRTYSCLSQPLIAANNSAVVKNDKILFYSYLPYSGLERNKFDIYNWQTNTWSVGVLPQNLVMDESSAMAVSGQQVYIVIGNKLYQMNI